MKKKLAALLLSAALGLTTVAEAGAAAFDDQGGELYLAELFSDEEGAASGETFFLNTGESQEEIPSAEDPSEQEEPSEEDPSEEEENPSEQDDDPAAGGEDAVSEPEIPAGGDEIELFGDTEEPDSEKENEGELFSAGEPSENTSGQEAPEVVFDEAELLAAQVMLEPGTVVMAHWRREENGKWRLIKSVEEESSGGDSDTDKKDEEGQPDTPDQGTEQPGGSASQDTPQEGPEGNQPPAEGSETEVPPAEGSETEVPPAEGSETEVPPAEGSESGVVPGGASEAEILSGGASEETLPGEGEPVNSAGTITYYDAKDGIVHIKTLQSASEQKVVTEGDYLFDEEGYLVTGRKVVEPGTTGFSYTEEKELFFMDEENAKLFYENVSATPYYSNLGQMQKSYWLWTGTAFRYYSSGGGFLSVQELKAINEKKGTYTGYYKISGKIYCLKDDGVPREGFWDITDIKNPGSYYFLTREESGNKIPGAMLRSAWRSRTVNGRTQWRYFTKNGRYKSAGVAVKKLDTSKMGNYYYLLDGEGYILKNTMAQAAKNKAWYLSNSKGQIYRSALVKYNGVRYYFGSAGKRAGWTSSWHYIASAGYYYYFGSKPGQVEEKQGWQLVKKPNGKVIGWFYYASNGNHYKDFLSKNGCYFDSAGKLAAGVHTVDGKTYFFQSSTSAEPKGVMYRNTWIHSRNKWYYAGSDGVLYQNAWKSLNGSWYYFQNDCTVLTNSTATRNGVKGYVDSRGKFCTGWVVVSNASNLVKYVDPATGTFAVNRSVVVDGLTYWFDSNGYRINDVTNKVPGPYYVEVDRINGVMTIFNAARTIPVKSIRVSVGLPGTPTPTGRYTLTRAGRWQALMGPSWGQYATHVDGAGYGGIFVHSVACTYANSYNLPAAEYNKLGTAASHGCIRCCVADTKWVYDNCNGAKIYIYDGTYKADEVFKGPLGRRPITPLRGSGNFDPTDPAVP